MEAEDNHEHTTRRRLSSIEKAEIKNELKEELLQELYCAIGKSILKKIVWFGGAVVFAALAWLSGHGVIKLGE